MTEITTSQETLNVVKTALSKHANPVPSDLCGELMKNIKGVNILFRSYYEIKGVIGLTALTSLDLTQLTVGGKEVSKNRGNWSSSSSLGLLLGIELMLVSIRCGAIV
ncbi:hypothetical protein BpHYR1_016764 [Brachionus plicatilis]|uniref:Uncharacterized protein n=1 Tax=Brachionus plicatilis TaxID=10195 RepID=A0A3M7SN13_BRAPC|nr:hypothetical protein BpHYR1_016764 [Brachionus plicatilis]